MLHRPASCVRIIDFDQRVGQRVLKCPVVICMIGGGKQSRHRLEATDPPERLRVPEGTRRVRIYHGIDWAQFDQVVGIRPIG